MRPGSFLFELGVWLSHGANGHIELLFKGGGGFRRPLSYRIGRNILAGGVMSVVPWPTAWLNHFIAEANDTCAPSPSG